MAKVPALPFVRSPYNYDLKEASDASGLDCSVDGPGKTKQSFAEEADINTLIRRFGVNGQLPAGVRMPTYGDFTGVGDFQSALNAVSDAQAAFMRMPADVRSRFGNDPGAFVDFCSDEANRDEAVKLGLVPPPPKLEVPEARTEAPAPKSGKIDKDTGEVLK
ncbi:internal scaffolding protein [Blackfly microvirus SF02]|uniref:Internal scaffolding protein n=1 Tax=Blackfly microvirus SF02 TaxID=2576452 RepID=A0A4P8PQA9_9VIRU|nr:internal scaffolding protein [Blackfly microvirus SF02]